MNSLSQKQLKANHRNSKLGGVKTDKGKNISKYNATKHGLLCKAVLIEWEDEKNFNKLEKNMKNRLKPVGELELLLVDRIIANVWRLKRALEIEKKTMEYQRQKGLDDPFDTEYLSSAQQLKKAFRNMIVNDDIDKIVRYETTIERSLFRALHELQRIQATRSGEKIPTPLAVDINVSGKE